MAKTESNLNKLASSSIALNNNPKIKEAFNQIN